MSLGALPRSLTACRDICQGTGPGVVGGMPLHAPAGRHLRTRKLHAYPLGRGGMPPINPRLYHALHQLARLFRVAWHNNCDMPCLFRDEERPALMQDRNPNRVVAARPFLVENRHGPRFLLPSTFCLARVACR